ncbi:hypothetical protein GCM10028803_05260 [Larkinella knui]|uniref:Uncharacterized protein n=1 Tax=Larkinella knui TaxID=2025310 RepID=A0A3P1CL38_9BACT|nr:hypothetical protein [Larkinella knui]RRB13796.1 hypothetical protein EHT87_16185 [Larkinella knui]
MARLQEYDVRASFSAFAFYRNIPRIDYCTFRTDSCGRLRFTFRRTGSKFYHEEGVAIFRNRKDIDDVVYIKIKELKRMSNGKVILTIAQYIDFFSWFSIWTGYYSMYLSGMPDEDIIAVKSYIES